MHLARSIFALAIFGALLFWLAGSAGWPSAWLWLAIATAASATYTVGLWRWNPRLLSARSRGYSEGGVPAWDKALAGLGGGLLPTASWVVSALDRRFAWAAPVPNALQLLGAVGLALGWGIFLWAAFSNRFFESTVRLQEGHQVQTGGPYRRIRHPGYLGLMIYQAAAPLLLGSWWGVAIALTSVPLIVLRTALEDRWLQEHLPGYREYAARVPHRLAPGLW